MPRWRAIEPLSCLWIAGSSDGVCPLAVAFRILDRETTNRVSFIFGNTMIATEIAGPVGFGIVLVTEDFGKLLGELLVKKLET